MPELTSDFIDFVLKLASGEITAKAELAIFKDRVIL